MVTIATLKEVKDNENRVGLTPLGVKKLIENGQQVLVQKDAGINAGFSNGEYEAAGAALLADPLEIAQKTDIIVKVKEPLPEEYAVLDNFKGKILFTYLHLSAAPKSLTERLLENKITGIAYETVFDVNNQLPLLKPMSQVAGVLAVQYGAQYLQRKYQGRGVSLGVIDNAPVAEVVVVGGGTVGATSAITAAGLGCKVTLLELREERIEQLKTKFREILGENLFKNVQFIKSTPETVKENTKKADLLVGAVLVPGAKAPQVVTEELVGKMKKGAVIVDVAIDQGGCVWGSRPTSHSDPIYEIDGKIFCCITNMPGQVALQSTQALTNATLPYLLKLASLGISALKEDKNFAKGLNTYQGKITYQKVAEDLGMLDSYLSLDEVL